MPRRPLSSQLTRMNLVVTGTAMVLAFGALGVYDAVTFRRDMVARLSVQAQIVGTNSVSALLFNDRSSAGDTLKALGASPRVLAAEIRTHDNAVFASYRRAGQGAEPVPLAPPSDQAPQSYSFDANRIAIARQIVFENAPVGIVYIESDLTELYQRLTAGATIAVTVLFGAMLAALAVSRIVQRTTSRPLAALAAVARRVSHEKDYSVRADDVGRVMETSQLVSAFNEMLSQIQERERSLEEAREHLETRVEQRTADLNAANAELEAFSYSVSHDLRAPLRHITGFASMLAKHAGASLDERCTRDLEKITDSAGKMGRLIDDLLAFSRMGRASVTKRRVRLLDLVKDAQAEVANDSGTRDIVWTVHPLPEVDADPALLKAVLVNLLSNAVKYTGTRDQAQIEVGTKNSTNGEVVVYVRDNGVGFDPQYTQKLFGVFQRLHRADEFSGTGIGLANVRRIIQRHGGHTWAEGEVDRGATFSFSLPIGA